jgi:multiple sugar transport system permease protein
LFNLSLTGPKPPSFVGLANYKTLLSDGLFFTALANIGLITVSSVILEFIIGFSIAHLLLLFLTFAPLTYFERLTSCP